MNKTTCMAPDCEDTVVVRGNCSRHYNLLRHIINRSKGKDEPVTWELLVDAGLAASRAGGKSGSEFNKGVLAALAEHRRGKEPVT